MLNNFPEKENFHWIQTSDAYTQNSRVETNVRKYLEHESR